MSSMAPHMALLGRKEKGQAPAWKGQAEDFKIFPSGIILFLKSHLILMSRTSRNNSLLSTVFWYNDLVHYDHPPPPTTTATTTTTHPFLKGTMSPQLHAQVDEKHFEIVGPTFSNIFREFRRLLYRIGCKCKLISTDFEKLSIFYRKWFWL